MMGISFSELEYMTERDFNLYRKGFHQREIELWKRARFQAWVTVATQSSKPPKIQDLLPLPGDEVQKVASKKVKVIAKVSKRLQADVFKSLGLELPWQEESAQQT